MHFWKLREDLFFCSDTLKHFPDLRVITRLWANQKDSSESCRKPVTSISGAFQDWPRMDSSGAWNALHERVLIIIIQEKSWWRTCLLTCLCLNFDSESWPTTRPWAFKPWEDNGNVNTFFFFLFFVAGCDFMLAAVCWLPKSTPHR